MPRITSADVVKEVLVELFVHAQEDPALQPNDLAVLEAMVETGIDRRNVDVVATLDWLIDETGLSKSQIETALKHLRTFGYCKKITKAEIALGAFRHYYERRWPGRGAKPAIYRLADAPPDWRSIPEFVGISGERQLPALVAARA